MKFFRYIFIITVFFSSCKKDDNQILYGYQCYPMEEGRYVIYNVVDIFHDLALVPAHDTNYYQIKEVIGEEELDGEGEAYRKLYRYHRSNDTLAWVIQDVWTVKNTGSSLETLEENKRRISMAFSISYDQTWNYNALNEDDALAAYYDNIYIPITMGDLSYDSSVVVEIEDVLTYIEYKRQYDIYATNVGRIYSAKKDLQITDTDTLSIQKGSEIFYTAVGFGIE